MDSFSKLSRLEIIEQNIDSVKSGVPFLFGLFVSCGSETEFGDLQINTDLEKLFDYICKITKNIIKNYEKINKNAENNVFFDNLIKNNNFNLIKLDKECKINKLFYQIIFENNLLQNIFYLLNIKEDKTIEENITCVSQNLESIRSFIKGVYLGCATSSIKISEKANEKTSSGYHLEFASKNLSLLREVSHLLAQFDIYAKLISRKNNYVLYIKDAEHVSDMLALVGSNNSVISLQNEIAKREFRNKINRQTNCLSGNISKTVEASIKQLNAIEKIDKKIGLNSLPPDLEEVALMRIANPEEPLAVLLQLSNIDLTKSGLNHRLRKIIAIAEKLPN